jgi:hydrogenase maturation protease
MAGRPRTVVIGLGNPVRADDGVGLAVAGELGRLLALEPIEGVAIRTSERAGFELLELLSGAGRALIVDCLEAASPRPGRVRLLTVQRVSGAARLVGAHDLSIGAVIELAHLLGVPMPEHVEILGIEAADTTTLVERLTPAVAAVVGPVAQWLHTRLVLDRSPDVPLAPHAVLIPSTRGIPCRASQRQSATKASPRSNLRA